MRPVQRQEDLVVREIDGELLVYDLRRHKAFCLEPNIAWIWRRCTGRRDAKQIARALESERGQPVGEDVVVLALHRLRRMGLVEDAGEATSPARPLSSRRELLRRAAALGGLAVLAIPAPAAGQAATCLPAGTCVRSNCTNGSGRVCCSGGCRQNSMSCGTGQTGFQCG